MTQSNFDVLESFKTKFVLKSNIIYLLAEYDFSNDKNN